MDCGPAPAFRWQSLFQDLLVFQGGREMIPKVLLINFGDAKGRVLLHGMRFKEFAHELDGFEMLAIGPNFFRLLVFRIAMSLAFFIEDESFESMCKKLADVNRRKESPAKNHQQQTKCV